MGDMENIAVINGTSEENTAAEPNTFTQELFKIYEEGGMFIPFLEIARYAYDSYL